MKERRSGVEHTLWKAVEAVDGMEYMRPLFNHFEERGRERQMHGLFQAQGAIVPLILPVKWM